MGAEVKWLELVRLGRNVNACGHFEEGLRFLTKLNIHLLGAQQFQLQ